MAAALRHVAVLLGVLVLVGLVFLTVGADVGWARAGGGGSFGGGGGGGFSGGSSGSGGESGTGGLLVWLCVEYPAIGYPVVILLIVASVFGGKMAREGHVSRIIRRGAVLQKANVRQEALSALRSRDPAFDEGRFLERIGAAFVKIQDAWSHQNLAPARAFISDGIHERFSLQIDMQRAEGYRNLMENVRVHDCEIVAVYSDDHFDTIHVCIPASAVDYNVDTETERRVSGSTRAEPFTEYWSFHRRHGVKSVAGPGSIEGNCPHCAAPLNMVDRAKCENCGSTVNSGEHDWVLAEITQAQEWRLPAADRRVPGLSQLKQADANFSVQHVEDRTSVMFYRLKAASFFDNPDYATPILSEQSAGIPNLDRLPADEFWKDPAIGKVETLDVECGQTGGVDRVRVTVRWSGTRLSGEPGKRSRVIRQQAIYTHVYVLVREHGVKSLASQTFSSSSCGECGAPIAVSKEKACAFCGTSLVDGRHDWVLEEILPLTHDMAFRAQQPVDFEDAAKTVAAGDGAGDAAPFFDGNAELSLAVLARVVLADGEFHAKEEKALVRLGRRWGLTNEQMQAAVASARQGDVELPVPVDRNEAIGYLRQLIRVSLADGRLSAQEKGLLYDYGERMNYSKADVRLAVARERKQLYQHARRLERERKGSG